LGILEGIEFGAWSIGSSSKFKVQSSKFENSPEINEKTWNLELGTLNPIELDTGFLS